jgi:hypothetical protein
MVRFDPRLVQYNAAQTHQFYKLLAERVRVAPGVQSAALTQNLPLGLEAFDGVAFVPDGFQMPRDRENFTSTMDTIDEAYFPTMGIRIIRGRNFLASDTLDAHRVAVVNGQFAKHYWPGVDAVGKHIRLDSGTGTPVEIVGVAQTIKYRSTMERPMDFVYLPLAQHPIPRMVLLLRSNGDPLQLVKSVKDVVRKLDPNLPMLETRTYEDLYRYSAVEGPRVGIEVVGTLGFVGVLLAIAGLYGLVAYNVSRRTREFGIRMALGALPSDVLRLVMGNGLVLVGMGTLQFHAVQCRRRGHRGLRHGRALDVSRDHAGGLRACEKSSPDCANAGAAIRIARSTFGGRKSCDGSTGGSRRRCG